MDDIIFEKDYRETESAEYDKWCDEVFDRAVNCGMLKAYSEAMDKIPKIIVPEDKKNYEYLLERCDAFVKQHRGYIKGIVDYHRWHAEINMFLPFAEFDDSEDLAFLKEIAEKSQTVCFSPDEEGGIRVHIFINYFEELMSAEHKSYIEYDAIMQDKKLSELLVPFPVSWTVKMKKKQKETQDILSYHTQAAGCSDKARAKASGGRQPIEECGRTGL